MDEGKPELAARYKGRAESLKGQMSVLQGL